MLQKNRFGWYPPYRRLTGPDPEACVRQAFRDAGVFRMRIGVQIPVTSQWLLKRVFGWLAWSESTLFPGARPIWCSADSLPEMHPGFAAVVVDGRRVLRDEVLPIVYEKFDTVCRYVQDDDWHAMRKALSMELQPALRGVLSRGRDGPNQLERHLTRRLKASTGREVVFRMR